MPGGTQAHLIDADDGNAYVVKFRNNPQHPRVLVNELVSSELLTHLQIATPPYAIVNVSEAFLAANPEAYIQTGSRKVAVEPGCHFGSRYPGDPDRTAIFDFVPDPMLLSVVNCADFLGILVFDRLVGNTDGRQSIFFRGEIKKWIPGARAHPRKLGLVTLMIDNGFAFNGAEWTFVQSSILGLYPRHVVYQNVASLDDFEPWISRAETLSASVIDAIARRVPPAWIEHSERRFDRLVEDLWRRTRSIRSLVEGARSAPGNPFPNWRVASNTYLPIKAMGAAIYGALGNAGPVT